MLFPIKNRQKLEDLEELVALPTQVNAVSLQDKLSNQNYHENIRKLYEPLTDTIKSTSENLTKTKTETSIKNNKAIEKIKKNFRMNY